MIKQSLVILSAALLLSLAACGAKEEAPPQEARSGGWTLTISDTAAALPEEVQSAFSQTAGDAFVPVALVGEQVVAGKNEMLLCAEGGAYKMVVLYVDLQGKASMTGSADFTLTDYTQGGSEAIAEALAGGWQAPDEITALPLPEEAQTAFDKALGGLQGGSVEPMALLGTQVVAGMNYAFLCRVTPEAPDALPSVQVAVVYADLQGGASFTGFCALDHARYNQ